jgi:hypothetical protein
MRIVHNTSFNRSRPPTERRVTLCTVHLVTPFDFEDARSTLGTVARVPGHEPRRGDVVRIARVLCILVRPLAFVALGTRPVVAHSTLPRRAQKAATIFIWTSSYKLSALLLKAASSQERLEPPHTPVNVLNIYGETRSRLAFLLRKPVALEVGVLIIFNPIVSTNNRQIRGEPSGPTSIPRSLALMNSACFSRHFTNPLFDFDERLGGGHEAPLAFEQKILPALLVASAHEFLSKIITQDLSGPTFATGHTVGILTRLEKILFAARGARTERTEPTLYLFPI